MSDGQEEWREKYEKHLRSARWKNMRNDFFRLRGRRCEHCGSTCNLELHHKTYDRLGCELTTDLEILCLDCHYKADRKREEEAVAKRLKANHETALNTYATKKYGEDWDYSQDVTVVEEEFEAWLAGRVDRD